MKRCIVCGKEFDPHNGRQICCSEECSRIRKRARKKEYNKEWYQNNKGHALTQKKEYYQNNKEYVRTKQKEYYQNNKEKFNAKHKEYQENNKEQVLAKQREYYWNNREQALAKHKKWYENNYIHADREGNNFCVYIHTDPLGKVYIGRSFGEDVKTVNLVRWQGGSGYQGQKFYDECIAVYGWDNIRHELLEWGLTYEEVIEREKYWIKRYDSRNPEHGYNIM